jgi:DNA adenine methylase
MQRADALLRRKTPTIARRVRPIVKWAGGKSRVLDRILEHVPKKMRTYAEPFAGGAAVFFALAAERHQGVRDFDHAILADQNEDLVACYRAVRDSVEDLIEALGEYRYDKDMFYAARDKDPSKMGDVERGARLLFLNRTCFNGLWRVNSKGKFNVPFGRYTKPKILDAVALREANKLLADVDIRHEDFQRVTKKLERGDFVYLDPPYAPASETADFTAYAKAGFGHEDQERLAKELVRLRERGVQALLSNADTKTTRTLYAELRAVRFDVRRSINSDPTNRGHAAEVLVMNWDDVAPKRRARR